MADQAVPEHRRRRLERAAIAGVVASPAGLLLAAVLHSALGSAWFLIGILLSTVGLLSAVVAIARSNGMTLREANRDLRTRTLAEPTSAVERLIISPYALVTSALLWGSVAAAVPEGTGSRLGFGVWAAGLGTWATSIVRPHRHRVCEDKTDWAVVLTAAMAALVAAVDALADLGLVPALTRPQGIVSAAVFFWFLVAIRADLQRPKEGEDQPHRAPR